MNLTLMILAVVVSSLDAQQCYALEPKGRGNHDARGEDRWRAIATNEVDAVRFMPDGNPRLPWITVGAHGLSDGAPGAMHPTIGTASGSSWC